MSIQDVVKKYKDIINATAPEYYFPFSLLSLNRAIGDMRGLRGGRMYQIAGKESAGKTTLSLDLIAQAQKNGHVCAYFDFEHTFVPEYAESLGVNIEDLLLVTPMTAEQGLNVVEALLQAQVTCVVVDSVPSMLPKEENEKDYNDSSKIAGNAGIITRFCKRVIPMLANTGAIVIMINQLRANMSTMSRKETKLYGPFQLHHSTSIRLELTRLNKEDDRVYVDVLVAKNKLGTEQQKTKITLLFGKGISVYDDILTLAVEYDIVQVAGKGWHSYGELKVQGAEKAIAMFPMEEIKEKIIHAMD
jgi:recombination protein RecA